VRGVRVTRLGRRLYKDELIERKDPRGRTYYWIGGEPPTSIVEGEDTDVWAVANGYVSVCPLRLDLTDYRLLERLGSWKLQED
jgi:5'-nucleotidase